MWGKIVILIVFRFSLVLTLDDVKPQLKIIGGYTVRNKSDFPHQVSLRLKGSHFCGGAIIDHSFILTAAHCCFDSDDNRLKVKFLNVFAGDLDIRYPSNSTVIRRVEEIVVHPKYNARLIKNDIALWKVSSPFFWNQYVQPVDIANKEVKSNTICNISGWGVINYDTNKMGYQLQYAEVPVKSWSYCRLIYPEVDNTVICAGGPGKDSCQGDSGGAMVCKGSLTGIVSYGRKCGIFPGVYTDVYNYRTWITKTMRTSSGLMTNMEKCVLLSAIVFIVCFLIIIL